MNLISSTVSVFCNELVKAATYSDLLHYLPYCPVTLLRRLLSHHLCTVVMPARQTSKKLEPQVLGLSRFCSPRPSSALWASQVTPHQTCDTEHAMQRALL